MIIIYIYLYIYIYTYSIEILAQTALKSLRNFSSFKLHNFLINRVCFSLSHSCHTFLSFTLLLFFFFRCQHTFLVCICVRVRLCLHLICSIPHARIRLPSMHVCVRVFECVCMCAMGCWLFCHFISTLSSSSCSSSSTCFTVSALFVCDFADVCLLK